MGKALGIFGGASSGFEVHIQAGDGDVSKGQDTDYLSIKSNLSVSSYRAIAGRAAVGAPLVVKISQNGSDVITISIPIGPPSWTIGTFTAVSFAPSDLVKAYVSSVGTQGGLITIEFF